MAETKPQVRSMGRFTKWIAGLVLIAAATAATTTYSTWRPHAEKWVAKLKPSPKVEEVSAGHEEADAHAGHDHAAHSEANSIVMSPQARKNIGLQIAKVELRPFTKTVTVPGIVVERAGRSTVEVTAPLTGVVTRIYPIEGEAIEPGQKLFDVRLTFEDLVQSQSDLLQTAEELDVTTREIKRIEKLSTEGALSGKQLLERQYESQKLEAVLRSKRQSLVLHGLTTEQVDDILKRRELLKELTVVAPTPAENGVAAKGKKLFQIQAIKVSQGQQVDAGASLAVLADHAELYIKGEAFERDVSAISKAADQKALLTVQFEAEQNSEAVISDLTILYLASSVHPATRTLDFFVLLPNELLRDATNDAKHRFISWRFRPGQRVQLQVPIETLPGRIVLPINAIAQEGVETYVFSPNGDHLERRNVHVEYRDERWAVIANDGSLFPGDSVAISGAPQLQMAVKNKSGGAIDPHAGHNH